MASGFLRARRAPGLVMGVLVFLTIREPKRGRLDAIGGGRWQAVARAVAAVPLGPEGAAFLRDVMGAAVCCLWGWGLAW